jgi:hypothetical protein
VVGWIWFASVQVTQDGTAVDVEDHTAIPAFQAGEAVEKEMGAPNVRGGAVVVELKAKNKQDIVRVHLECLVVAKDEDEELHNLAEEAKFNQKKKTKEFSAVGCQTKDAYAGATADVTSILDAKGGANGDVASIPAAKAGATADVTSTPASASAEAASTSIAPPADRTASTTTPAEGAPSATAQVEDPSLP